MDKPGKMLTHCPECGRGLSAKYRIAPHRRFMRRAQRRIAANEQQAIRRLMCRWNGFVTEMSMA